ILWLYKSASQARYDVKLSAKLNPLADVLIKTTRDKVTKDTIEFNADAYKSQTTNKVAELLQAMPGFALDPDGKLRYRGRSIEALLINGVDIANADYGALTKNLPAAIVDKVQVIENYQKNKVLAASGLKSNAAAVNLTIKPAFLDIFNGTLGITAGTEGRFEVDATGILLGKKMKTINFGNGNNIAKSADGGVLSKPPKPAFSPIQWMQQSLYSPFSASTIAAPDIPTAYSENNTTCYAQSFLQLPLAPGVAVTASIGSLSDKQRNSTESSNFTQIDSLTQWEISSTINASRQVQARLVTLGLLHNANSKFAGDLSLKLVSRHPRTVYSNYSSKAVADTLLETTTNRENSLTVNYECAIKAGKKDVLQLSTGINAIFTNQTMALKTGRFSDFFSMPQGSYQYRQATPYKTFSSSLHLRTTKVVRRSSFQYGIAFDQSTSNSKNNIAYQSALATDPYTELVAGENQSIFRAFNGYTKVDWQISKQNSYSLSGQVGLGQTKPNAASPLQQHLVYDASIGIKKVPKAFSQLKIAVSASRFLPSSQYFFASPIASGGESIFTTAATTAPISKIGFEAVVSTYKSLNNNSLTVTIFGNRVKGDYIPTLLLSPGIILTSFAPSKMGISSGLTGAYKSYVFQLKSTIKVEAGYDWQFSNAIVNLAPVNNSNHTVNINGGIITAFRSVFNIQLNVGLLQNFVNQAGEKGGAASQNRLLDVTTKGIVSLKKQFFASFQTQYLNIRNNETLFGTIFLDKKFMKGQNISLSWHNVFGRTSFLERAISPNNVTEQAFNMVPSYIAAKISFPF
ncbi:MAG: hypothetical protein EAY75_17160, partial [Bacteroidetes bacterium]